jgi:hypothetical protein
VVGKQKTEQFWSFIAAEARAERRQQLVGEVVAVASEAMQHDHGGRVLPRWCDDVWRRQCAWVGSRVGLVTDRLPANAEDRPSSTFILRLFMAMADERRASFGAWADSPTLVMPRPVGDATQARRHLQHEAGLAVATLCHRDFLIHICAMGPLH